MAIVKPVLTHHVSNLLASMNSDFGLLDSCHFVFAFTYLNFLTQEC